MKTMPTLSTEPPLPATVEACHEVIRETWCMLHQLIQRVQVLEEQVQLNSRTSSKPPSRACYGLSPVGCGAVLCLRDEQEAISE
jgi:hypothetical protein